MREAEKRLRTKLASWFGNQMLPPVISWLEDEIIPFTERAIQARAARAVEIGEIDHLVHSYVLMNTGAVMRWVWANGAAHHVSAWIDPQGTVNRFEYGGHGKWIIENRDMLMELRLVLDPNEVEGMAIIPGNRMMKAGWVRYSGGSIQSMERPNDAQLQGIEDMIRELMPPPGYDIEFLIFSEGKADFKVSDVLADGLGKALDQAMSADEYIDPLSSHPRKADSGGGTSGPYQQGDGQDVQHSWSESVQDGSTAKFDKSWDYLTQDMTPEIWWSRQLLEYLDKNYPGKKNVFGPEPDSGSIPSATGPGQQFATMMNRRRTVKFAEIVDPSDTDLQHDQLGTPMSSRPLNPESILYKGEKGRGFPHGEDHGQGEAKTRLHGG